MSEENFTKACYRFGNGTYATTRAIGYLTNQCRREASNKINQYENEAEYYLDIENQRPKDWTIFTYHLQEKPNGWLDDAHGPWPNDGIFWLSRIAHNTFDIILLSLGLMLFYARLPSSNKSDKSETNDKMPMLAISKDPTDYHHNLFEFRYLYHAYA